MPKGLERYSQRNCSGVSPTAAVHVMIANVSAKKNPGASQPRFRKVITISLVPSTRRAAFTKLQYTLTRQKL